MSEPESNQFERLWQRLILPMSLALSLAAYLLQARDILNSGGALLLSISSLVIAIAASVYVWTQHRQSPIHPHPTSPRYPRLRWCSLLLVAACLAIVVTIWLPAKPSPFIGPVMFVFNEAGERELVLPPTIDFTVLDSWTELAESVVATGSVRVEGPHGPVVTPIVVPAGKNVDLSVEFVDYDRFAKLADGRYSIRFNVQSNRGLLESSTMPFDLVFEETVGLELLVTDSTSPSGDDDEHAAARSLETRIRNAGEQYDDYSKWFADSVNSFADQELESIFEDCIAEVALRDPLVPPLLTGLKFTKVDCEAPNVALRDTVMDRLVPHLDALEVIIFRKFNKRLMTDLRSHARNEQYDPWMTRALQEWTHQDNDDSSLVQDCITTLLNDERVDEQGLALPNQGERVGDWLFAYLLRDQCPENWSTSSSESRNRRYALLSRLESLLGGALQRGHDEVLHIVKKRFPDATSVPSPQNK